MGLFSRKKKEPVVEERSVSLGGLLFNTTSSYSNNYAMKLAAFYAGVNQISNSVALLPIDVVNYDPDEKRPINRADLWKLLNLSPDQKYNHYNVFKMAIESVIMTGNAYFYIERDNKLNVKALHYINSDFVTPALQENGSVKYIVSGFNEAVDQVNMIHLWQHIDETFRGISLLKYAHNVLMGSKDAEDTANKFYKGGAGLNGVLKVSAPLTNEQKKEAARAVLKRLIIKYNVTLVSVGNGTASRESELFLTDFLKTIPQKVFYVITNEAGASVYSASALATKEFPEFDVGQRSAASIARRVQDPLAELVKIDPKAIGVGQYQHDMDQKRLGEALSGVVEDCVNRVGIDLNTASAPLLGYVSGISGTVASNVVAYREEHGAFTERKQLLKVPKLGPKAYEQCAGFLRIRSGRNPLDNTGIHPESYGAAERFLEKMQCTPAALLDGPLSFSIRGRHSD